MAAKNNLNEYQFRYRPTGPQNEHPGYFSDLDDGYSLYDHKVEAIHKPTGRLVGEMLYHSDGPLFMIEVGVHHQRRGVAEGMVRHARDIAIASKGKIRAPRRAYSETDEGAAFAEAMIKRGLFTEE